MTTAERLMDFLQGLNIDLNGGLSLGTRLFETGALDSLSLFNLAQWIEDEVGRGLDLTAFNILEEWATPAKILKFLEEKQS